jgi:hypothetical protein
MVHLASKRLTQPPIEQHMNKETIWKQTATKTTQVLWFSSFQNSLPNLDPHESRVSQKLEDWHLQNVVASLPHI